MFLSKKLYITMQVKSPGFYRTHGFYKCSSLDTQSDDYNPNLHAIFFSEIPLKVSLHLYLALPICPFPLAILNQMTMPSRYLALTLYSFSI